LALLQALSSDLCFPFLSFFLFFSPLLIFNIFPVLQFHELLPNWVLRIPPPLCLRRCMSHNQIPFMGKFWTCLLWRLCSALSEVNCPFLWVCKKTWIFMCLQHQMSFSKTGEMLENFCYHFFGASTHLLHFTD
jgi:hypothetical protein